ncbi:MAG TPA: hypothetical protein P5120_16925 [Spirochaetota bacterium]|nr:hypothetical protein [Spirochaetota bacterium]
MMIRNKNSGHDLSLFSSADYLNHSFSGRKAIETRHYPYDYTAGFSGRFDYSMTPAITPYFSAGGDFFPHRITGGTELLNSV